MHPSLRRAGALAVALLALMPISSARAMSLPTGNAVLLRYRFVPGQTYAYYLAINMRMSTSGTAVPASAGNEAVTLGSIVRYHILRVDASGGADAQVSLSEATVSTTTGSGTTTTKQGPVAVQVHLGADGTIQGAANNEMASYGLQAIGNLPRHAVAPGARWTSTAVTGLTSAFASLSQAPIHVTAHNVFSRYLQFHGQRVAAIDSTGTVQFITDTADGGTPLHMHLTAGMTGRSLFGLAVHRTVTSQQHLDLRLFVSSPTATAANAGVNVHAAMSVSLTPYGG